MTNKMPKPLALRLRQYILTGLLVVLPLWVTWLIFGFLLRIVSSAGGPLVRALARGLVDDAPTVSRWLLEGWVQTVSALGLTLAGLYLLGWAATRVIGRRLLGLFDSWMARIPLVQTIYGSTKKLLTVFQEKPAGVERVVLVDFPSPEMKAVGLVTRTFTDEETGEVLAAVYVPTTPNPTSGYLEIVPLANVVSTNWSLDDAMTFIISGGAVGPEKMTYSKGTTPRPEPPPNQAPSGS